MKKISTIVLVIVLCKLAVGQQKEQATPAWLIQPSIAWQSSDGDMASYFGNNLTIGLGAAYKTQKNWRFGIDGQYLFSDNIKNPELILAPLLTSRGYILNGIGNYASVSLLERGFFVTGELGKSFNFWQANANSGPDFQIGSGYLMHWIEIKNAGNDAPQLLDEYAKGYDRLSGGMVLRQSIGYTYLSSSRRVNMRLSLEIMQAFTRNYRGFDFSTGKEVSGNHTDWLYGIRFQWMLPIYSSGSNTFYYD